MLEKEYEKLVHYLEGMISDGCQIVIGGNLMDWEDCMTMVKSLSTKERWGIICLSSRKDRLR